MTDSRAKPYGVYRRRQCVFCHRRFSTIERFEEDGAVVNVDDLHEFERALRSTSKLRSALSLITSRLKGFRARVRAAEERTDRVVRDGSEVV